MAFFCKDVGHNTMLCDDGKYAELQTNEKLQNLMYNNHVLEKPFEFVNAKFLLAGQQCDHKAFARMVKGEKFEYLRPFERVEQFFRMACVHGVLNCNNMLREESDDDENLWKKQMVEIYEKEEKKQQRQKSEMCTTMLKVYLTNFRIFMSRSKCGMYPKLGNIEWMPLLGEFLFRYVNANEVELVFVCQSKLLYPINIDYCEKVGYYIKTAARLLAWHDEKIEKLNLFTLDMCHSIPIENRIITTPKILEDEWKVLAERVQMYVDEYKTYDLSCNCNLECSTCDYIWIMQANNFRREKNGKCEKRGA